MLEQQLRQRVIGGELLQHFFVGRRLAGRGFPHHGQLHPVEQDLAKLARRSQIERAAGEPKRLLLQREHPLAEHAALRGEKYRIEQHAVALHAEEHFARRQLDTFIDMRELGVGGDARAQRAV